jgi:GNAT superfamily N-acetyltransferase
MPISTTSGRRPSLNHMVLDDQTVGGRERVGNQYAILQRLLDSVNRMSQLMSCFLAISETVCSSHHNNCIKIKSDARINHSNHLTPLNLIPLSEAWDAHSNGQPSSTPFASLLPKLGCRCFDSEGTLIQSANDESKPFRLYLATEFDDLPPIAKLTIDVFDVSAIALSSSSDWNALEQAVIGSVVQPAIGMYNSWAQVVGYTEVLSGLRKRMRNRMTERGRCTTEQKYNQFDWLAPLVVPKSKDPSTGTATAITSYEDIAARSSLILSLARPGDDNTMEVVASIELRLQPTDAKIPFSQPWLDKVERRLVSLIPFLQGSTLTVTENKAATSYSDRISGVVGGNRHTRSLRPYLCNLCVSPSLRSLGIGRALCRIVEAISRERWAYSQIYLHVDPTNDAARTLYENEGYVDVGRRWNVIWSGGANEISYYVKKIRL